MQVDNVGNVNTSMFASNVAINIPQACVRSPHSIGEQTLANQDRQVKLRVGGHENGLSIYYPVLTQF